MGGTYIAVATSTVVDIEAINSIYAIERGPEDHGPVFFHSARGDLSRNKLTEAFLQGTWDCCLYLDGDMLFPPDLLTRLKAHNKAFVGGLYFRREQDPMWPLAFEWTDPPSLPFTPIFDYPPRGLLKVNATGSGCWLVHRDVYGPVRAGMLNQIQAALGLVLDEVPFIMDGPMPEVRGDYQRIGADLRFCYYARRAGFPVWLDCDPELEIGHFSHVALSRRHYDAQDVVRLRETQAGLYGATATYHKERGMDDEAVKFQLRQYEAQMKAVDEEAKRTQAMQQQAAAKMKELATQRAALSGAVQALKRVLDGGK